MAEEDVVFGSIRHLYGGIEPSHPQFVKAYPLSFVEKTIKIEFQWPTDSVSAATQQKFATAKGVMIRRSEDIYPNTEFDGDLVFTSSKALWTSNGGNVSGGIYSYIDTIQETGKIYYYSVFSYSELDIYNRSNRNRAIVTAYASKYHFGFDMDMDDPDPDTRITYPSDVQNASYVPAGMDFANDIFDYGSWPEVPSDTNFMPKPCVLNMDGTVRHYLNPNNYTQTVDGAVSDVGNSAYNSMMEWPKIYTKRWQEGNIYKFRCSDSKIDDDYECWCNYDIDDNEIPNFYTSIFPILDSNFRSYASTSTGSFFHADTYFDMFPQTKVAEYNSDNYYAGLYSDRLLIMDLLILLAKHENIELKYGRGYCDNWNGALANRRNNVYLTKGLFAGGQETQENSASIKVFGMVHYIGFTFVGAVGLATVDTLGIYAKITPGLKDGSTIKGFGDYNEFDQWPFHLKGDSSINGWVKNSTIRPFGPYPNSTGASATTYALQYVAVASNGTRNGVYGRRWDAATTSSLYYPWSSVVGGITPEDVIYFLSCRPKLTV